MDDDKYNDYYSKTFLKYSGKLLKYIISIVQDRDAGMDILQDTFLKLYEKRIYLEPDRETTFSYLCRVSKNASIDYIKKITRENKKMNNVDIEEVVFDNRFYADIEDMYIHGEILSTLNETINAFPEKEQIVLLGNVIHGKPLTEVAVDNKISVHCVKKILRKFSLKAMEDLKIYFLDDYTT